MASRILLADDSITIQKVVNLTFVDEGIEVVAVSNGDVAERRLAEVNPDLVLADIFMPGKNGYELCEAIKESSQFSKVPVVLLVGAFEPFDQTEAKRVRADAHLTKPFESRTLVETVRSLISGGGHAASGPVTSMHAMDEGRNETSRADSAGTMSRPIASQLAGKLDLSAMVDDSVSPLNLEFRSTGELGSPSPVGQDVLELGVVDAHLQDAVNATLADTYERFEPTAYSPVGDFSHEVVPPLDLDTGDSRTDRQAQNFDEPNPFEAATPVEPTSFETIPGGSLHEVNISGAGEGEQWFESGFETSRLDQPASDEAWRAPATASPLSYQSPDFSLQTETSHGSSDASTETACATLLAVDEPLGDVLFGEGVSVDSLAPLEMASSDSLGLELSESEEVAEAKPALSTQFDLVEIAEAEPAVVEATVPVEQAPAEPFEQLWGVEPASDDAVERPLAVEPASADVVEQTSADTLEQVTTPEAPATGHSWESIAATELAETQPVSEGVTRDSDWTTPRAASYSTAQLDSVAMSIEAAEDRGGKEEAQRPEQAEEASFTTAASWTEEEAHFTPIDVEAVAVGDESLGESAPLLLTSVPDLMAAEEPASNGESLVAQAPDQTSVEPPAATLPPAAIEEIVRRVVAQMSESVVREVAWEVVPDCVERVIDQLTRESLSKRAQ